MAFRRSGLADVVGVERELTMAVWCILGSTPRRHQAVKRRRYGPVARYSGGARLERRVQCWTYLLPAYKDFIRSGTVGVFVPEVRQEPGLQLGPGLSLPASLGEDSLGERVGVEVRQVP
jgi:hypothetical protein